MDVLFLDNDDRTVRDALEEACGDARSLSMAVAFVRSSSLVAAPGLSRLVERGGQVKLLAGVDFELTDLDAVAQFEKPPSAARVYLHPDGAMRRVFHPKVYLTESAKTATAIVGSSNLTDGGLVGNLEASVLLRGSVDDPAIAKVREYHSRLWNSPFALPVTANFRQQYRLLQDRRRAAELALRAEADVDRAHRGLRIAIAEAVTRYATGGARKHWLLITSPANFIRNI